MFGTMSGTVRNIGFENITIKKTWDGYVGKSAFVAKTLSGKLINVYLTGTMDGTASGSGENGCAMIAYNGAGSTVYNVRVHIDGMVANSNALTVTTAPTHWGNYYASYTGTVTDWYGSGSARDLGG